MPITTYKSSCDIIKPSNPEIRELLEELHIPNLLINEIKIYKYTGFFNKKPRLIKTRYEILWKLDDTEYQLITAVSTLNDVLIYLYGLHAGLNYDKRKITRYRWSKSKVS